MTQVLRLHVCVGAVVAVPDLRMATVMASEEQAHGQITSGLGPRAWKTFRKASHDEIDPEDTSTHTHTHKRNQTISSMSVWKL